jgi:hypothetical protein
LHNPRTGILTTQNKEDCICSGSKLWIFDGSCWKFPPFLGHLMTSRKYVSLCSDELRITCNEMNVLWGSCLPEDWLDICTHPPMDEVNKIWTSKKKRSKCRHKHTHPEIKKFLPPQKKTQRSKDADAHNPSEILLPRNSRP